MTPEKKQDTAHHQTSPKLRLKEVSFVLPIDSRSLLEGISIDIFSGDRLAIVGSSGAGKTLLLRLMNRLEEPTKGAIDFVGRDIRQIFPQQLRRSIVLVPQESKLLGMTVAQTLAYPLTLMGLKPPEIQQRVDRWCARLHISSEWMSRNEMQLSVGQRQLVAIARALVMQPQVLLLDEPTSALDRGRSNYLLEVLKELSVADSMAIVMTNHQLDVARDFSSRVLYLQDGKVEQNSLASEVNWIALQEALARAELQAAREWD
ncbi:ATP-binding cassette domain-containing protein [Oscillatoriales cyanobacterium LEGE 11467]|uniref:ATP-binding cassette domain-containing protein n=1 Tax=Zarconia navalis LEGE 11467 TaxID=1828826 RepID=A0A928VYJ6_9CYAN|nr:ATP-binding cassette domain-containing protein [Zarconia navalis]MBE9041643.1 ATP-binding cassette domain-containing protein [Zarconia navalis LEGE 11467]